MINLAISIGVLLVLSTVPKMGLDMSLWLTVPFGLLAGVATFIIFGRKVQEKLELVIAQMQKEVADKKVGKAIETLKAGLVYKNLHIYVGAQLHSQIGMLYYLKKEFDNAFDHLKQGFKKHYVAQGMLAAIYYRRKDYAMTAKAMEETITTNAKEAFVYGLAAWFFSQQKETGKAIEILQRGQKKLPDDGRLSSNLTQLQNNRKLKMKVFGDIWSQFMLERPPRLMQQGPPHSRVSRKAMFR